MSTGVNCLNSTQNSKNCSTNAFNEKRPTCTSISDETVCNLSQGCYFNQSCKYIDSDYCGTAQTIEQCRKDSNDYCYFANNKCQVCNQGSLTNTSSEYNLISMDGRQCFDKTNMCKPYYQQNNHAACRKYCEFLYEPNNETWQCDYLENTVSGPYVHNHKLVNDCSTIANANATKDTISNRYSRYFNSTLNSTYGCNVNNSDNNISTMITIYPISGNFAPVGTKNTTHQLPNCGNNFVLLPYQPLNPGESGPVLTWQNLDYQLKTTRLIGFICSCPKGFYVTNDTIDTCVPCDSGMYSIKNDSTECISISNRPLLNTIPVMQTCQQWQKYVQVTENNASYYICEDCPLGYYGSGTECIAAPKSWYVKLPEPASPSTYLTSLRSAPESTQEPQYGLQRCENGTTAEVGAYDKFLCKAVNQGEVVTLDGEVAAACPAGTRQEPGSAMCSYCPAGQTLNKQTNNCEKCPAGTWRGALDSDTGCLACPEGSVSEEGAQSMFSCKQCTGNDVIQDGKCQTACNAGHELTTVNAYKVCQQCPRGSAAAQGQTCTTCSAGLAASLDQSKCVTSCNPGEGAVEVSVTRSGDVVKQCEVCQSGYYSSAETNKCEKCGPGTVAEKPGSASCAQCSAGSVTKDGISCQQCGANEISYEGVECKKCGENEVAQGNICVVLSRPSGDEASNTKKSVPLAGILAGVFIVLGIIIIVIGVVFGLRARRGKQNRIRNTRNVKGFIQKAEDQENKRDSIIVGSMAESNTRESHVLI